MREIEGIDRVVEKLRPHWAAIDAHFEQENNRFKALFARDHDVLGRVLKCHLIVEHYLERFLCAHFRIDNISEAKLSFFQKAVLLPKRGAATAFIKPGILKLNSIRNQFGHTLEPVLTLRDLGAISTILEVARPNVQFAEPINAIEAFTTVACTWLIVPPPHLQQVFADAFSEVRINEL